MAYTLTVIFFLCIVGVLCACPPGFAPYGQSCYKAIRVKASWAEANVYCDAFGGHLATIETEGEQHFLEGYLKKLKHDDSRFNKNIWIGGNDMLAEKHWIWVGSLAPFGYTRWAPHSPDNGGDDDQNEHCLDMDNDHGYKWNDSECVNLNYFLCEMPYVLNDCVRM